MRIAYLDTAKPDLIWFRLYYRSVFPEGEGAASKKYLAAIRNLRDHPQIGRPTEAAGIRELPGMGTPFSIIYKVSGSKIEVLRVWNNRADRGSLGFNEEQMEFA